MYYKTILFKLSYKFLCAVIYVNIIVLFATGARRLRHVVCYFSQRW